MKYEQIILAVYAAYLVLFSVIAFLMYGKDKKMAQKNTEVRVKEKTLLFLTIFGGAVGAFFGRLVFHHKTNKIYFTFTILLALATQLAVLAIMVVSALGGIA